MDEAQIAVVAGLTGKAYVRNAEGELRELSVGDALFEGETVVTPDGVMVELTLTDGSLMVVDAPEMMLSPDLVAETAPGPDESAVQDETIEAVLAALESGEDLGEVLEATAAGPSSLSGPSGEGHSFIRLGRIAESTSEFDGIGGTTGNEAEAGAEQDSTPVDAIDDEAATDAGVPVVISVENNDIFAEGEDVISISQPENGVAILNDDDTVTYIPNEGFSGTDTFTYTATNPDGTQGDTAVVTVEVNPPADPPPPPPVEPPVVEPPVVEPPVVETLPEISIGDDVVIEGGTAQVVVSIDKPWDEPISVAFETEDDTATVIGGDYDPETGTITFAPGVTELVILVSTNEDNIREGSEFFNVNLSDPVNATIADGEGVVEIVDVYEDPTITIGDDVVVEGDTAQLVVSLSRAVEEEVTVDFVSADGTAIEVNGDYLGTSGTLTFAPGETELVINVVTLDDAEDEASENMFIDLSNPTNAEIEDPQGRVTIRDNDSPPPPPPPPNEPPTAETEQVAVDEAALASGSNPGSNADTVSGQLDATDPDGDPLSFVPGVQVGTYGTLEINADGTYVYTLNSRFDTNPDADDGPVTAIGAEQFQYTVLDGNGGSDIGLVTINIIDDVPQAVDDGAYAVEEDTTESISFASLLANDTEGADQPVSVSLGSNAANGVVIVVGDTFEYTPNPGFEGADSFTYILTDADGDTSEATVLLVVDTDSEPTVSVVYAGERDWVAESALDDVGSDPSSDNESASGDFNITHTGTDTTDKLEVQDKDGNYIDVTNPPGGGIDVEGDYGVLTVQLVAAEYVWTYTLNGATDEHTDDAMVEEKDTLPESFAVRVTDSDGDTDDATLEIDVRDDGPQAVDDGAFDVEEDSTEVISFADVLDNDIEGADQPVSVTLGDDATNGTVVVVGETFEYTPNEGYAGPDSFTYIITDADGDTSEATVSLNVDSDSVPMVSVVYAGERDWVAESALDDVGSDPSSDNESASGDFNITHTGTDTTDKLEVQDKDGNYIDVTNPPGGGIDVEGDYGVLNVQLVAGEYVWTYTLSGPTDDHDDISIVEAGDTVPESFAVRVTDTDGDTDDTTLDIDVRDDGPEVEIAEADEYDSDDDSDTVPEDKSGDVSIGAAINIVEGADQDGELSISLDDANYNGAALTALALTAGVPVSTSATIAKNGNDLGVLTIDWDGTSASWSFEPVGNTAETNPDNLEFTFTTNVTDSDGDIASDSHQVEVDPVADVPTGVVISFGDPSIEGNDLEVFINQEVGDQLGDDVINGTPNFDYNDIVVVPLDFGGEFANQVITINPSVDITGSWNHDGDGAYFDDNWGMIVYDPTDPAFGGGFDDGLSSIPNGAQGNPVAFFFYNENTVEQNQTEPDIEVIDGVQFFRFGAPQNGENDSFAFSHTPSLDIQLNENGQAYVVFGAETTQQSESVVIDGVAVADAPDTYVYGVDLDVGLADTDGSESMTVTITLNTFETGTDIPVDVSANLLDGSSDEVPDTGAPTDNQWVVTVAPGQSLNEVFELRMLQTEEGFDFSVTIVAETTEAANGDTADTLPITSGVESVPPAGAAAASSAAPAAFATGLSEQDPVEEVGSPDNELAAGEVPLIGTDANDVFMFDLADAGSPASYEVSNFGADGQDALDLSDLLQGESEDTLENYLNITSDGTNTVIEIASSGFSSGYDAAEVDSTITLLNVDLGNDTAAAIAELLSNQQLNVD